MAERKIQIGDMVRITNVPGEVSEPVRVADLWGDQGQATVEPAVFGSRYWNVSDMERAA